MAQASQTEMQRKEVGEKEPQSYLLTTRGEETGGKSGSPGEQNFGSLWVCPDVQADAACGTTNCFVVLQTTHAH